MTRYHPRKSYGGHTVRFAFPPPMLTTRTKQTNTSHVRVGHLHLSPITILLTFASKLCQTRQKTFFQNHSSTFYCICISVPREKYGFVCLFVYLTHCLTIDYQLCSYNVPTRGKLNPIDFRVMNMCFVCVCVCVGGGGVVV